MQYLHKSKGSVTVFLTLLFLLVFSLLGVVFENVRVMSSEGYVRAAAHSAAMTAFGDYNRELYQEYGLFAYGGFDGIDVDTLERELLQCLEENVQSMPTKADKSYSDLYRLRDLNYTAETIKRLTDSAVFQKQVKGFLKKNGMKDMTQTVLNKMTNQTANDSVSDRLAMAEDFEKGKYHHPDTEKDVQKESGERKTVPEETLEKDSAGGNPLTVFSEMIKSGVLSLVCDSSRLSEGVVEPCQLPKTDGDIQDNPQTNQQADQSAEGTAGYLKRIIDNPYDAEDVSRMEKGAEKIALLCYANQQFSYYGKQTNRTTKYGLEYLLTGKQKEKDALSAVVNRLLGIRTLLNFAYTASDTALQSKSLATATAIAGFTGLPPVITAVQYTILLILSFQEACVDITALLDGRSVPLVKTAVNFKMEYEKICLADKSLFAAKAKQYHKSDKNNSLTDISYQQYLWFFLLLSSKNTIRERIFDLIQYDLRERYNQSFCIGDCICGGRYCVSYHIPNLFERLPLISVAAQWNTGTRSLEVSYGYKSE